MRPCLSHFFFIFSMIIISVTCYYTRIMIIYERQNSFELLYSQNTINLFIFIIWSRNQIFNIAHEDRLQFLVIGVLLFAGITLFYFSVNILTSLESIVIGFGLVPCIVNLRVRLWMAYQCKIQNYVDLPSESGLCVDLINLVLSFGGITIFAISHSNNWLPIVLASLSSILIGIGIGEVRIICSFKMVREKLVQKNYDFHVPLVATLMISQIFLPIIIYPSTAMPQTERTFLTHGLFYLCNGVLSAILLAFAGSAITHVELSTNSLCIWCLIIPIAITSGIEIYL